MRIIPWLEVNTPELSAAMVPGIRDALHHETLTQYAIRGLRLFAQCGVTSAIVSTRDGESARALYPALRAAFPDMAIIGGLKTFTLPGAADTRPYDWTNGDGWRQLTRDARQISRLTGSDYVVFDSETSLAPFHAGQASIDSAKIAPALRPLALSGVVPLWWYPHVLGMGWSFVTRPRKTFALVEAVAQAVPMRRFISDSFGYGPARLADKRHRRLHELTCQAARSALWDIAYVTRSGRWIDSEEDRPTWTVETLLDHAGQMSGCIVYPGGDWIAVAEQCLQHGGFQ